MSVRVRTILSGLDSAARTNLKKLLPKTLVMPTVETAKYPSAILSVLPKEDSYSILGLVAEDLLRYPVASLDTLHVTIAKYYPDYTATARAKVTKSKTTQPFLDRIAATRAALDTHVRGTLVFDTVLRYGAVEGHPDAQTETQIFEVKLTGLLKKNWTDFLFQVFAYGALSPASTDLYLVLPLQSTVWHASIADWTTRTQFRDALNLRVHGPAAMASPFPGRLLCQTHSVGNHIHKGRNLAATILELASLCDRPFQIFLAGSQTTNLTMKDADIAAASAALAMTAARLYVHSPYLINLCHEPGTKDDYGVMCLIRNLQYSAAMGIRGVVVHVGKSTTMATDVAEAHMRANLTRAMEHATAECPILLETPAGQGTEMLTVYDDFVRFVQSFASPRLRICVDTCHVFATGQNPLDYIQKIHDTDASLLQLVHFNDSAEACGSCLDRHAFVGTGKIGIATMTTIAEYCSERHIPMVVE